MIEIRRILCAVDFSESSRRALDHALAIARWYKSSLACAYVSSVGSPGLYGSGRIGRAPTALSAADHDQLRRDLQRFVMESEWTPGLVIDLVVREGSPAAEILHQAGDMDASLLVMGTHGRSGLEKGCCSGRSRRRCCAPPVVRC